MNYCVVVWDSCGKTDQEDLDKLHKRAASIIKRLHSFTIADISHVWLAYTPVPPGIAKVYVSV